jgi:hypothetical protein
LSLGYPDTGVRHRYHQISFSPWINRQANPARLGKFKGVGQKILEHLFEPLNIGFDALWTFGRNLDDKIQLLFLSHRLKELAKIIGQPLDGDQFRSDVDMAGLDLGKVKDVIDQVEEVVAGGLNRLRVFDLLLRQIFLGIIGKQLGQDQGRVERSSQFVRHIG